MFGLGLHAYVLMSNHYHLVIELREVNLSRAIHWLNVSYTVWFNRRHGRSGHFFQGRFKSVVVEPAAWGLELSRYVHLNPVRLRRLGLSKGEVRQSRSVGVEKLERSQVQERIQTLRSYPWSSFRAYVGVVKTPAWLTTDAVLGLGGKAADRCRRYREYCEEAIRQGMPASPWDKLIAQTVLGTERFVFHLAASLKKEHPGRRLLAKRPSWKEVVDAVERIRQEKWERFRDRHGDLSRDLALYLGRTMSGMSLRELSERAQIQYVSAATAVRRFAERTRRDRRIKTLVQQATGQLHNE